MTSIAAHLSPPATDMIRMDHTHVLATFHRYRPDAPVRVRKGLAGTICLALEIHAQLEEEVFYPEMRLHAPHLVVDSATEHDEMRTQIARLRALEPDHIDHDATLYALMRMVLHHVADEETVVLPAAERLFPRLLDELGARMTRRRLALAGPRAGEIALNMGRAVSGNALALGAVGALGAALLLSRAWSVRRG